MNIQNIKRKAQTALAATTVAVLSAPAMAEGAGDLMTQATTDIGALKAGLIAFGAVVIGIAVTLATIGILKRGINKA